MPKSLSDINITLGYFLDGHAYPDSLHGEPAVLGEIVLGPMGFLSLLEEWLGLPLLQDDLGRRIARYLQAATVCCREQGNSTFYAQSLQTAPWPTARRLLSMRDTLALAGWRGEIPAAAAPAASARIADLARIEQALGEPLHDLAFRLERIIRALGRGDLQQSLKILLVDDERLWPGHYRRLLAALQKAGVSFSRQETPQSCSKSSTHLGVLQHYLATSKKKAPSADHDFSLVVLEATCPDEAAQAIAMLLPELAGDGSSVLVRAQADFALEEVLASYHLPATGFAPETRWRSILQLLPICLRMHWQPRSMQTLLDFLLLPTAPVDQTTRNLLANALQEYPGVDNEVWQAKVSEAREALAAKGKTDSQTAWAAVESWLLPDGYAESAGIPLAVIKDLCTRLGQWATQTAKTTRDGGIFLILAAQCRQLTDLVQESNQETFSRPTLESMLDHVCQSGAYYTFSEEQAAPWHVVEHPGQIHAPVQNLVWWQFTHEADRFQSFWRQDEEALLAKSGILLPSARTEHQLAFEAQKRALLLVQDRCIVVLPQRENGEEVRAHALLDTIRCALDGGKILARIRCKARDILDGKSPLCRTRPVPVARTPLPEYRAEWTFAPKKLPARVSVTAAKTLLDCSFAGMLETLLHPRGPRGCAVPVGTRLLGIFAHFLVEEFLKIVPFPKQEKAENAMQELLDRHTLSHAAPLLLPENAIQFQAFGRQMRQLAHSLTDIVARNRFANPLSEQDLERKLPDLASTLYGRADLVWESRTGPAIWDMKWSYAFKNYLQSLDSNTDWQLAAYLWMQGKACAAAYWLLPQDALLGNEESGARDSHIRPVDFGECWETQYASLKERAQSWQKGIVAARPATEKTCEHCAFPFVCGRNYV